MAPDLRKSDLTPRQSQLVERMQRIRFGCIERLLVRDPVRGACELLGLDPLLVANEGKLVAIVDAPAASDALEAMRSLEQGEQAALVGHVSEGPRGRVVLNTPMGTSRVVDLPSGEVLPRIC